MELTEQEIETLNNWARTQPTLRGVFPYTENRPGLGDRLNDLSGVSGIVVEETDGDPSFSTDTLKFHRDDFYLTADSADKPIVNFRRHIITDHGELTGLLDNDHPQYYKYGDVITAEAFYLKDGGDLTQVAGVTSVSASWKFDSSIVASDPGAKMFRLDSATLASVTQIHIDDETNEGFDISTLAAFLSAGHRIYVQQVDDATRAALFQVTGPAVDNGGWWTIPVTVVASNVLYQNNRVCRFLISLSTAAGADHGALSGLADDDHLQYARTDGSRDITNHQRYLDSILVERQATAEAFYVQGNAGFPRPPEMNPRGIRVDDIVGFGDIATTAGTRQIQLRSPINITPVARFNGAWLGGASIAPQVTVSGTIDCSSQSSILGGVVFDNTIYDNINTAQGLSNAPTFQANATWNEENVGAAHSVFGNTGFTAQNTIQINLNSALTAWPNNSGVHLNGYIGQPAVRRASGITTGTLTIGSMAAFATNRSLGGFKGFFGTTQVGAGATVTDYHHYYAGSGGTDELLVTGTITTEYGVRLNNLSRGTTRISLWSDSTTATMRHAGSVSLGKTTAPNAVLDVAGRAAITGGLGVVGSFYLQLPSGTSAQIDGGVRIRGTLHVSSSSNLGQNLTVGNQLFLSPTGNVGTPSLTFDQFLCATGIYPVSDAGNIVGLGFSVGGGVAGAELGTDGLWVADKVEAEAFYLTFGDISNEVPNAVVVGGSNVAFMPPRLTTTQRDALTAVNGMMIYNTTLNKFQGYEAGAWANLI